ncbi:MAG: hypothetical protein K2P95_04360 [Hyphomonadaceae bacterium]|nr:hypothetical protein [Hyphomonadaceae bacterium]
MPKDVAFEDNLELLPVRAGDVLTIYPARYSIPEMMRRLDALPKPPTIEQRDKQDLPERPGL